MQAIFDVVFSFQKVGQEAVAEAMDGKGMPALQQALRNGLNRICCTIQQPMRKYGRLPIGCCAKGHVSHVLSARLSSRPMGWSYLGACQIAHLRVHRANGVNLSHVYIEQSAQRKKGFASEHVPTAAVRQISKAAGSSCETLGNIPSLASGTKGWSPLLRGISNAVFEF